MSHARINDTIRLKKLTKQYNQLAADAGILHLALMALLCDKVNGNNESAPLPEGVAVHVSSENVRVAHEMAKQKLDVSVQLDTGKHTMTITVVKVKE